MQHHYAVTVTWTGNTGAGTAGYTAYSRDHEIAAEGKSIASSSEPKFRGDASRWNPEELLVAALSSCHQLWYLHLCADAGITVIAYVDRATGVMDLTPDGGGHFTQVHLHPEVTIAAGGDEELARELHDVAHDRCYIANSVRFPVACTPVVTQSALDVPAC